MWLLEATVREMLETAQRNGTLPTVEQQEDYAARYIALTNEGGSRVLTIAGETAEIDVSGILTPKPSFMARIFGDGNTTYGEIVSAIAEAENNPQVTKIIFVIASPGGSVDGLFDTMTAIANIQKPTEAQISGLAASAAYMLASKTDKIVAGNVATRIGSIGVRADFFISENLVSVTSSNAPKKAPDVSTEKGKAMVREELDALEKVFVDAIAQGRGTTSEKVSANFGQGGILLANEALKRGMIDEITGGPLTLVQNANSTAASDGGNQPEANKMDLNELKASHPDVFQAVLQQGEEKGVAKERDRVGAHLKMGEASGDMKTAIIAINDGSEMTATLQAGYMAAGMNRKDVEKRAGDDPTVEASAVADEETQATEVADLVEAKLGVGVK